MKVFRFIFYVLQHGSLKGNPVDFEERKKHILQLAYTPPPKSFYTTIRTTLIRNVYTNRLVATLAFVKNLKKSNKQLFFIDERKLCYIRIFKAASTSMLREVLPLIDKNVKTQNLTDQQIDLLGDQYVTSTQRHQEEYAYFTLIRNPFHRIVSVYLDLFDKENIFFSYQTYFFGILKRYMKFNEFVSVLAKIPYSLRSPHFASQHQIIKASGGLEKIKFFRIEKDTEELANFLSDYRLTLTHSNRNKSNYRYQDYYDTQTANLVYDIYKADITTFGYENEYAELLEILSTRPEK